MRNKVALCFIIFLSVFLWTPASSAIRLTFVTDSFPPYYYTENGVTKGLQYELAKAVFKKMNIPFEIKFLPWKRALMMAESLQADGIFGLRKTHDRQTWLIYPKEPLMVARTVIFKPAESQFEYTGVDSLKGKKVGVIKGYTYGEEFDASKDFIKEEVSSLKMNFLKLAAGRIDLVAAYMAVGIYTLREMNLQDKISYSHSPIHRTSIYIGFSREPGHGGIARKFSKALNQFKHSPECRELIKELGIGVELIYPCYGSDPIEKTPVQLPAQSSSAN